MNTKSWKVGPGAVSMLLMLVVVSMSVLGALALLSAKDAERLSDRAAEVAQIAAELDVRAEMTLSRLDALAARCAAEAENEEDYLERIAAALPEGTALEDRRIIWTERLGGRALECAAEIAAPGAFPRLEWHTHRLVVDAEAIWN